MPILYAASALAAIASMAPADPSADAPSIVRDAVMPLPMMSPADAPGAVTATASKGEPAAVRFGAANSWRWELEGSWMNDFSSANQVQGAWYASWFLVENFSFDFGAEGAWFSQPGGNTWGGGPAVMFRWHFLARETWSIYADGGCGLMFTGANVPSNGSQVNFTPRLGMGVSFDVAPNARILTGVRWAHISNANLSSSNDGRNSIQLYAGLSLPF